MVPLPTKKFIPFSNPAELLAFYDSNIQNGNISLHKWQRLVGHEFAKNGIDGQVNDIDLIAANDSGKSKNVVAPCALWHCCQFDTSETVITTASGSQLDRQTGRYLKHYSR